MAEITAKEIAAMLGMSPAAISLALNGKPGVSDKTRAQVMEIATQYGYEVRRGPVGDSSAKKNLCFLIYVDQVVSIAEHTSFSTFVLQGLEARATAHGYHTLIRYFTAGTSIDNLLNGILGEVDALVIMGTDFTLQRATEIQMLLDAVKDLPVTVIDNLTFSDQVDCIGNDNFVGAKQAVTHLLAQGCRKIAYLRSRKRIDNFDERRAGMLHALKKANLEPHIEIDVAISSDEAFLDLNAWLNLGEPLPDAFFAENDVIAAATIRALNSHGISVPEQVSVIGFDDVPICEMTDPPLTTIRSFKELLGSGEVDMIHRRLQAGENTAIAQKKGLLKVMVSTQLVIRGSVMKRC